MSTERSTDAPSWSASPASPWPPGCRATLKAFAGGAHGIVISREYEEMKVEHLRAVGRAVREAARA
jgi:hypothetical protein